MKPLSEMSHYEVLEVAPDATDLAAVATEARDGTMAEALVTLLASETFLRRYEIDETEASE